MGEQCWSAVCLYTWSCKGASKSHASYPEIGINDKISSSFCCNEYSDKKTWKFFNRKGDYKNGY